MTCFGPAQALARHRKDTFPDASVGGLARLVDKIHDNAVRIDHLTALFYNAPGYPRPNNLLRSQLIRDNEDLFLRAEQAAGKLRAALGDTPPPGQFPFWQLLRDTENGAHTARIQQWTDYTDQTVRRRLDALSGPKPAPPGVASPPKG